MTVHVLWVIVHSLAVVVFVNRYIAGIILRLSRGKNWDETRDDYEPTVTAVIPMFNEGAAIKETLQSLIDSAYPVSKLKVICVDDCSSDDSYEHARQVARKSGGRLKILRNRTNLGKRRSIIRATREADSEIIVSVDSDVVVDPDAVRQLVRRFTDDRIAAVGGWVDVRNKQDNWLTRMQVVKYWYSYFFLKNLEWGFRRVMCLSGCLTAYRRRVLVELESVLENRSVLGVPIKYGEDRFLTRQIVKAGYLTTMTLDARCCTFVPSTLSAYFSQQLRWRRSNIIDYTGGFSHVWRLNPVLAIHFFSLFALLLVYPIAVVRALAAHKFFPALVLHTEAVVFFGMLYRWRNRKLPRAERVGPLSFIPLSLLMPVTYALLTPLALFTLDTASWETRNHEDTALEPREPARDAITAEIRVGEPAPAVARARSHAQLPAA
ncbi:MAG TPA: glycosyltransferase [Kofleriaceae bacterium]|jgi:cellulose synthase/poly-beta-1,6-N-acetylglucosamine synthase-like glycosyltransferase|nr:glycosyltransferase [Kofleriaceae bacterium]